MSIGDSIRDLRIKNRLTVREFAERLGICDSTVRAWENGMTIPGPKSLQKISDAFHVPVTELLHLTETPPSKVPPPTPRPQTERTDGIIQRWEPHEGHHFTRPYTRRTKNGHTIRSRSG